MDAGLESGFSTKSVRVSQPEDISELVGNELRRRLSQDKCPTCNRGAEAHKLGATALSQLAIGYERLEIARAKNHEPEDTEREMNPLSLVATVQKLPEDHPKRAELLEMLRGQIIALQEAERSLSLAS